MSICNNFIGVKNKTLSNNIYIDLTPNISMIKAWACKVCEKENPPDNRVDTISIFGDDESFCIKCWLIKLKVVKPDYANPFFPETFQL